MRILALDSLTKCIAVAVSDGPNCDHAHAAWAKRVGLLE